MATSESPTTTKKAMTVQQKAGFVALGLVALLLLLLVFNWSSITNYARVGTAYSAHIACSCRYIGGRDMASCVGDLEDGMEMISLTDDPENQRMRASLLFIEEAIAEKRGDFGCIVLNEEEMQALD